MNSITFKNEYDEVEFSRAWSILGNGIAITVYDEYGNEMEHGGFLRKDEAIKLKEFLDKALEDGYMDKE